MKKNTSITAKWLILVLIFSLSFSFNSCKDDDLPDYVGTWERTDESEMGTIKQTLKITETTFVMNMTLNLLETWVV